MTGRFQRLVCVFGVSLVYAIGCFPQSANAIESPNVLMAIDGMTMTHFGIFRNNSSNAAANDGPGTFNFNATSTGSGTALGRYKSFIYFDNSPGDGGGVSHNARLNSATPDSWDDVGSVYTPVPFDLLSEQVDIDSAYYPVIDRAAFGQLFDPGEYEIEVKFKPVLAAIGTITPNAATTFGVSLDLQGGFVWDDEANLYKRAGEQVGYNFATFSEGVAINDWYATAPKDANGYATWTVPVTSPTFVQRGFYYAFGNGDMRTNHTNANGGRVFNEETEAWEDVTVGFGENYVHFGGGPSDPARPNSKINVPNGVPLLAMGTGDDTNNTSLEIDHVVLKRVTPENLMARIDVNSGLTAIFGSGFTYGNTQPVIPLDGRDLQPLRTDRISRFDNSGMLPYLKLDMRTPDPTPGNEAHRFVMRYSPTEHGEFNGDEAVVNIRARLAAPLGAGIAPNLVLVAKELDGNDNAANPVGADEYTYTLALNQFNTSTFTTVSIPLSAFTLSDFVAMTTTTSGSGPNGFTNAGDGSRTVFNLYELAGLVPANTGLLKLDLEFLEIRLPEAGLAGDYNDDGIVNAADYTVWRNNLGDADETDLNNNGDGGAVTSSDYTWWKQHYGDTAAGSGGLTFAVPEPATLATVMIAVLGFAATTRRRPVSV